MSALSEFDIIQKYFENLVFQPDAEPFEGNVQQRDVQQGTVQQGIVPQGIVQLGVVQLGIGDDCAVINVPDGMSLCLSIDTMVEGVHFPCNAPPEKLAYRALAAALSDLAAMGAQPSHFTLSLTMPEANPEWLGLFSKGLEDLASQFQLSLVGGDTTKGPLSIAIQVHGFLPKNTALTRSHAQVGDIVAVTGTLGDAGKALSLLDEHELNSSEQYLVERYYRPSPRIEEGIALRSRANACIDISDGLLADAAHIARKSSVQLEINLDELPLSSALKSVANEDALNFAINAGDDYELLFTLSEEAWLMLKSQAQPIIYTAIGRVKKGEGVVTLKNGQVQSITKKGFKHFE